MTDIFSLQGLISFATLLLMEIVLGIDNILFVSILSGRLPDSQQRKAQVTGLFLALGLRILLLLTITWVIGLSKGLLTVFDFQLSGRDLILMAGGMFLIYKSTLEIHEKLEGEEQEGKKATASSVGSVIVQIILLDAVFSFDSILTAIGLVENIWIMILAVSVSVGVMILAANKISDFIHQHPTIKMLALSFLLLIGVMLILDGFHMHVPKGYIYFAIFFSLFVELLNMRVRKQTKKPVELREPYSGK